MDQVIAGRYALGPLLGSGGMARVYAADDRRLHRRVAIKLVPLAAAEPIARQRFVREARSAAGFAHPNAVAVYDAGESGGYLFLVMEMVDGVSLADRLAEQGALDPAAASSVARDVLSALSAAHAVGIVHRDVKPANILLGRDGAVKLADFGIAKRFDDVAGDVTVVGDIIGTPKYLAPEQLSGQPATPASDVYAVGIVLYEMLAGRPPFDAETPLATALAHRDALVPDLAELRPTLPASVVYAVHTALAKNPADRFGSADEMRAALNPGISDPTTVHWSSGGPVQPTQVMTPPGDPHSSWTPVWAGVVALLAIAGVAVAAVVVTNDDPDDATAVTSPASSAPAAVGAATNVVTTASPVIVTTASPSTVSLTSPPSADLGTIDGIIATLEADPDQYGSAARNVASELDKINGNGNGNGNARKAAELLDRATRWVESGELDSSVLAMLEPVLGPIAGSGEEEEDDD